MKSRKFLAVCGILAVLIAAVGIYPVSADIISSYATDYDKSTQKVHAKVILTGGEEVARASEYSRDFMILMDVSSSMRDMYKDKARLEWGKNATIDLLKSLYAYKTRVGVITFSDKVTEVFPLTFNFEEVKEGIENISSYGFHTNYGEGIQKAVNVLKRKKERKALSVIILLTDGGKDKGITNVGDAVDLAKKKSIMIYVVSFGEKKDIDEVILRERIAKLTGGEYKYTSIEELSNALIEITKMEEFLSAANLHIRISQSKDAVLDYLSIEEMVKPGVTLTKKDHFEFISPKLSLDEKIELEFNTFTAKEGNITAGIVNAYYTNKMGTENETNISILVKVPRKPPWEMYTKACGGIIVVLIALGAVLVFRSRRLREKIREEEEKKIQSQKEDIKKSIFELRRSVEGMFDKNRIVMSRELKEEFEKIIKKL